MAGQIARYSVQLEALPGAAGWLPFAATLTAPQSRPLTLTVQPQGGLLRAEWPAETPVRGEFTLTPRLHLEDPLGLWQVTGLIEPPGPLLVYPAAETDAPPPPQHQSAGSVEGVRRTRGEEEFSGLRPYQAGDSPRQISWRHVARTGQLVTRERDAPAGQVTALRWQDTAGLTDPEARISRLAAWVQTLVGRGVPFALELPGLPPQRAQPEALAALARLVPLPPAVPGPPAPTADPLTPRAWRYTLVVLGFMLLPSALRQLIWITLLAAGLLGYPYLRTQRPWPAPSSLALALLAAAGIGLLYASYGTLIGLDAGTALLVLLLSLKVLESSTRRDARMLSVLGLFMTLTHFFHSMDPLSALHALVSVVLLLSALHLWAIPEEPAVRLPGQPRPRPAWVGALLLSGLALPLTVTLFVFFPRPDGPLWQIPLQGGAQTGLGNSISPGDVANLAQSSAVAFRAEFDGPRPSSDLLYWRGPVYEAFDGLEWSQVRAQSPVPSVEPTGPKFSYTVTQEANGLPWVLALETPLNIPDGTNATTATQLFDRRAATQRMRYALRSGPARVGRREMPERIEFDRQLPAGNPATRQLAATWTHLPPEQRVEAGLNYLAQGGYTYTLQPPTLPEGNRTDAFLFSSKQGFCEHYASAFAVMMRAAGVPTRLVGGYQGGDLNPDTGLLTVRQLHAHAWTEVWLEGQGWVRVDPTAVVAPARIQTDPETALSNPTATTSARTLTPWRRVTQAYDTFQVRWNDLVIGYDAQRQADMLSSSGAGPVGGGGYWLTALGTGLAALLPILWLWRSRPRPGDPALRALDDLTRKLRLERPSSEAASDYVQRAVQVYPHLATELGDILKSYQLARYGAAGQAGALSELRTRIQHLRLKEKR
ncbi:transglutaminaseTgpA domain-containing protein [Deinococcus lacus]|uniref:TransglutaminaseTgpA domain-containing protein n=1 Tax=Deinococcus lacus TaxID=392561 RepID=A0ABW1YFZ8_9DEIO